MLKTAILSFTLTGGTTYDCITPRLSDGSVNTSYSAVTDIGAYYALLQAVAPSGGLKYKMNSGATYIEINEGEYINHPGLDSSNREPCQDSVYVLGSGTIKVEISYFVNG